MADFLANMGSKVGSATGTTREIARLSGVIHGVSGWAGGPRVAEFVQGIGVADKPGIGLGVGTAAGAAAGAVVGWSRGGHWILGMIAGGSAGTNIPALIKPGFRGEALRNMGQTGIAVVASRMVDTHPVLGFVAGWIAGEFLLQRRG